jgi:hypothetical protein
MRAFAGKLPLLIPPTQQSRWPASEVADLVGVGGTKHNWAFGPACPTARTCPRGCRRRGSPLAVGSGDSAISMPLPLPIGPGQCVRDRGDRA